MNGEIEANLLLSSHDSDEVAKGFNDFTFFADNFSHVTWINGNLEVDEPWLIKIFGYDDSVWIIDYLLNNERDEVFHLFFDEVSYGITWSGAH